MRIFVSSLAAGEIRITGDEHHYLCRVRRAQRGDAVELVDGAGRRAVSVIERITETETIVRAGDPELIPARPPFVRALVPLIKGDRMDSAIEKLVEVGIDAIVVWPATRSVVRLDGDRREGRLNKYRSVVEAAARQCGRAHLPTVTFANSLVGAMTNAHGERIVLDPASDAPLPTTGSDITLVSGPEGGFSADELEQLATASFISAGLGPRILRAETAPAIAVALIRAATQS